MRLQFLYGTLRGGVRSSVPAVAIQPQPNQWALRLCHSALCTSDRTVPQTLSPHHFSLSISTWVNGKSPFLSHILLPQSSYKSTKSAGLSLLLKTLLVPRVLRMRPFHRASVATRDWPLLGSMTSFPTQPCFKMLTSSAIFSLYKPHKLFPMYGNLSSISFLHLQIQTEPTGPTQMSLL